MVSSLNDILSNLNSSCKSNEDRYRYENLVFELSSKKRDFQDLVVQLKQIRKKNTSFLNSDITIPSSQDSEIIREKKDAFGTRPFL